MAEKAKIQVEDGVEFSKQEKKKVQEGLDWLKNWLMEGEKAGKLNSVEDAEDVKKAIEKLDNMNVFIVKDGNEAVIKGLESNKLHLTKDFIDEHGGNFNKALQYVKDELSMDENSKTFVAFNVRDVIEEPAIFVNADNLRKQEEHQKTSIIKSVITHEAIYAIGFEDSELECQILKLNENVEHNEYWDSDNEVYARLMQMRQELNLNPAKNYTLDEVKEMRTKCVNAKNYVADKVDTNDKMDWLIFEKYTDEQILYFLNETSDNGKQQSDYDVKIDRQDMAATMKKDAKAAQMEISCARELAFINPSQKQPALEEKSPATSEAVRQSKISDAQLMAMRADRDLS